MSISNNDVETNFQQSVPNTTKHESLPTIKNKKLFSSEVFKTLYTKETGELIHNLKSMNSFMKKKDQPHNKLFNSVDNLKIQKGTEESMKTKHAKHFSSTVDAFPSSKNSLAMSQKPSIAPASFHPIESKTLSKHNSVSSIFKSNSNLNNKPDKLLITASEDAYSMIKLSDRSPMKKGNKSPYFYCPHCQHCNGGYEEDQYFDKNVLEAKDAQNVLKRGIEFILENGMNENVQEEVFKEKTNFKMEEFINKYTKHMNTRNTYLQTVYFLQALIDDKIDLEKFVGIHSLEKLDNTLLLQGLSFIDDEKKSAVEFEKEIEELFDENMKVIIKKVFRKNFLSMATILNLSILSTKDLDKGKIKKMKKKCLILFLTLTQILSEISIECKEKAILLYKLFKMYFIEIEKKWAVVSDKLNSKVQYYKDLCKTILAYKNKSNLKIETISDVLFANKVSEENLQDHKKLIHNLLQMVNEKRDEIYMLKAQLEITNGELQLWIFDYDSLKLNSKLREKVREINVGKISQNINDEMAHKTIVKEEKSLIINADRFLIASGQRNYFFDQKQYYLGEVERLTQLYQKHYYKKKIYKKKLHDTEEEFSNEKHRLEKDLIFLRDKLSWERCDVETQTEVDLYTFKKMEKNHEIVIFQKRLTQNKLNHFIEKIKYSYSKQKPMLQKSLLNLIPELYNEKLEIDNKHDMEGKKKLMMDDFFYKFISDKFKLKKIINKNCEQSILSIIKFSGEDPRIDLLGRFLGIGEVKIRREILDIYLFFLKNLPISFFKIFDDEYSTYLMNTDLCFEMYSGKYNFYELVNINQDSIMALSSVVLNEEKINNITKIQKYDYFLLTKMYSRSLGFINDITNELKSEKSEILVKTKMNIEPFIDQFTNANKEFNLNRQNTIDIFKRNFTVFNQFTKGRGSEIVINIESFLNFFIKKYFFKIRVIDFLDVTLNSLVTLYNSLEKKINILFDNADFRRQGYIVQKEFEEVMIKLVGNSENKWKINEYFQMAVGSQDKEILSREEFTIFCMNTKEILIITLKDLNKR